MVSPRKYLLSGWTWLFVSSVAVAAPLPGLKDYGLREYVYTSKALPHVEEQPWKLVCQLPYNAQYTAWIQLKADATGKEIVLDSTNPLVPAKQQPQKYTTTEGEQVFEAKGWVNGEGAIYRIPAGVTVLAVKFRETGYDTEFAGSFSCNDDDYNILWQKATRTCYVCMRNHFMDCPDRERAPWMGDAILQMEECFYAFSASSHELAKKMIREIDLAE